jgi:hypothetical protein
MANYTTVADLVTDALWRANEPTDGQSDYNAKALEYLNAIHQTLVAGSGVATRDLATASGLYSYIHEIGINDWWWARKRGALVTPRSYTAQATIQADDTVVRIQAFEGLSADFEADDYEETDFLTLATPASLAGYEMLADNFPTLYKIVASSADTLTLDQPWIHENMSGTIRLYRLDLVLPSDFVRFASPPRLRERDGYEPINIVAYEDLVNEPLGLESGAPSRAAMLDPLTIRLNRYDPKQRHIIEVEYVRFPGDLVIGGDEPLLPRPHRRLLASGAAAMIAFDKNDAKHKELTSEFKETVALMAAEHRAQLVRGSKMFGQFRFRPRY